MAKTFRRSIDMTLKFINNFRLQHVAGDHSSTDSGTYYYDSTANRPAVRTNSAYKRLAFTDDVPGAGEMDAADINYDNTTSGAAATDVQGGLDELFDEKAELTDISDAIDAHEAASDVHPEYQKESEKGQNNGYASLDSGGKVPVGQIPDTVVGAVDYKGTWNANTNSPTLGNSGAGGIKGDYYKVSTNGATSVDGITDWKVGDWIIHNGTTWDKVDQTESVSSVQGRTGAVDVSDIFGKKWSSNAGNGTPSHTITHTLGTRDLVAGLRLAASPWTDVTAGFEIDYPSTTSVRIQADDNIATDELRITLMG